jgi:hypothetical protein
MECEGPVPDSQAPVTCPYPEPDELLHTFPFYFCKIHF